MLGHIPNSSIFRPTARLLRTPRLFYSTQPKPSDPLRILFCGSDEFSCESLKALHDEQQRNAELIRSIDVVSRPPKRTGRGLKTLREVPIKQTAHQLGLPIHERDTFTGWDMPKLDGSPINLIVAVSFGLFVPPRLLRAAEYGGLNIHPSLLPDLRGPAPLHHALLNNHSHTGVSLQTLSEKTFDAGTVLSQTPLPGIPIPPNCTLPDLHALLAPAGAAMLINGLRSGLHVPPYHNAGWTPTPLQQETLAHAGKITPADRELRWHHKRNNILQRARILGPLWSRAAPTGGSDRSPLRVICEDFEHVTDSPGIDDASAKGEHTREITFIQQAPTGNGTCESSSPFHTVYSLVGNDAQTGGVTIRLENGDLLVVRTIKVEGKPSKPAWRALNEITKSAIHR